MHLYGRTASQECRNGATWCLYDDFYSIYHFIMFGFITVVIH